MAGDVGIDLGEIRLGKQIGIGGYGIVYEAELTQLDDYPVAVKVLDPSPFQGSSAQVRFIQEAKILLSLRHPHIVSIYGCGIHKGKPYILMERFSGMNLHQVRAAGYILTPSVVLPFFRRTASALAHAHSKNVIHRDLKPENLMTAKDDARVIDFGIARIVDPENKRFTRTGGTPVGGAYSAPELADKPRLEDPRCDIYSLGACWFWLLTGQTPSGRNWESALTRIDEITPEYEAVIHKCLNPPITRFGTMLELEREIQALELGEKTDCATELLLEDNTMLVLGTIFEQEGPGTDEGVSIYELNRQMIDHVSKITLRIVLDRLKQKNFIRIGRVSDWNDNYDAYFVTDEGRAWVSKHHNRIEDLLKTIEPKPEKAGTSEQEDVPF